LLANIKKVCIFDPSNKLKTITMTTAQQKAAKVLAGYKVWNLLSPMERYEKVMINFTAEERRGVSGMRKMAQFIIDNNVSK
jgi:hypothetical protein